MTQPAPETQDFDEEAIAAALTRMGLLKAGEKPRCQPLPGGVSSDIWLVDVPGRRLCLKRALPRLKVEQVWEAPVRRNHYEWNWFRVAGRICPDAVPPMVGQDAFAGLFVMEYLDPALFPVWKDQLFDGQADLATAEAVASRLVMIHNATAGDAQIGRLFGSDEDFYALVGNDDGVFGCMSLLGCQDVCPKSLPLATQIAFIRRKMAALAWK